MNAICKGKNCGAIDGVGHSEDCIQEHYEVVNPEKAIIKKAIERYCADAGDPREYCTMVVNAADMLEWLLNYDSRKYEDDTRRMKLSRNQKNLSIQRRILSND